MTATTSSSLIGILLRFLGFRLQQEIHCVTQTVARIIGQIVLTSAVSSEEQYNISQRVEDVTELIYNIVYDGARIKAT